MGKNETNTFPSPGVGKVIPTPGVGKVIRYIETQTLISGGQKSPDKKLKIDKKSKVGKNSKKLKVDKKVK